MTVDNRVRTPLLLAGMGLLAVIALVGWLREPSPPAQAYVPMNPSLTEQQPAVTGTAFRQNGYISSPIYERQELADVERAEGQPRIVRTSRTTTTRVASAAPRQTVVVRRRKFSHSAAIVAGSAGAGAAIGALAGGGKGAAIGALAGGGAGLVYDRLTHKKTVRR